MIKFNEKELDNYLKKHPRDIKQIFGYKKILEFLDANDFYSLYSYALYDFSEFAFECIPMITAILLKSDIDFLPYLDEIPKYCFRGLPITRIEILDSVTSIDSSAFSNCSSLTSITIPDSVTSIGSFAFDSCEELKIEYLGTKEQWRNIKKNTTLQDIKQIICSDDVINN